MKTNLPISILIIGVIVAGGIVVSRLEPRAEESEIEQVEVEFSPITSEDNIYGNPAARIKIIEYSDFSCPFCRDFHEVMELVMEQYARDGEVAWIYRHVYSQTPDNDGPRVAAMASECVRSLNPDDSRAFWDYASSIFKNTPTSLTQEGLLDLGEELGTDPNALATCIAAERHSDKIERNIEDVVTIAAELQDPNFGTPYVLIVSDTGLQAQFIGNADPEELINVIELMLSE